MSVSTHPSTLLAQALAIAATGVPVFPCGKSKRPCIPALKSDAPVTELQRLGYGHGFKDASTDPDEIALLFAAQGARLIGVPTGEASNFDILDIDYRNGGGAWEQEHLAEIPETRVHRTGSGGRHYVFLHAPGVRNSAAVIAQGVDVRGDGGYACIPPSQGYTIESDADIAEWPDWLLEQVLARPVRLDAAPAPRSTALMPVSSYRWERYIQSILANVSSADLGQKHYRLRNAAIILGGILAQSGLSAADAATRLMDALPPAAKDRNLAARTVAWGLEQGQKRPITLPERDHQPTRRPTLVLAPRPKSNGKDNDDAIPPEEPPQQLPVIQCVAGELPRMVQEAETALLDAGAPIYQRSVLVRPAEQQYPAADGSTTHSVALVPITGPTMMAMLAAAATWKKWDGRAKALLNCDPPTKVVDILLANRGQWRFPVVRGVLTSPTIRPDGTLLKDPGYDFASRYYLMFPTGLKLPDIPDRPMPEDALDALTRLDRLLDGYDFVADGGISRSVALCILMTQVLRCGMAVSPLLAVSATAPGSGKSHLIDLASTIAIGRPCPIMGAGKSDEETEKGINTNLLSGVAGFSIDNVHRMVDLAVLNIATERPMVGIRLFGVLDKVEVENSVTIYMTGNNLPVVDEQVRRTLLCSMDVGVERPEQREFGDNDPIKAVLADRGRYIADILIIALAYLAHGTKTADIRPFGSYPGWSKLVREPLIWLGRPDPVASQIASRASDPETGRLRAVVGAWDDAFGSLPTTLAEATRTATTVPFLQHREHGESESDYQFRVDAHATQVLLQEELLTVLQEAFPGRGGKGSEIDTGKWGYWMRKYAGRVTDNKKFIDAGKHKNVTMWQLVPTQSNAKVGLGG